VRSDRGLLGDFGLKPQLRLADADDIARLQDVLRDALAVDECAARAAAVCEVKAVALGRDLAVDARHGRVAQFGLRILAAATNRVSIPSSR